MPFSVLSTLPDPIKTPAYAPPPTQLVVSIRHDWPVLTSSFSPVDDTLLMAVSHPSHVCLICLSFPLTNPHFLILVGRPGTSVLQ